MKKKCCKNMRMFPIFVFLLILACVTPVSAKTIRMTAYKNCIKDGKYVYCNTGFSIYRVNPSSGNSHRIYSAGGDDVSVCYMKKKGKYLYCLTDGPTAGFLMRINTKKFTKFQHASIINMGPDIRQFALLGNKIYFDRESSYNKRNWYVSKLDGRKKKKTSVRIKMRKKESNNAYCSVVRKKGVWYFKSKRTKHYISLK